MKVFDLNDQVVFLRIINKMKSLREIHTAASNKGKRKTSNLKTAYEGNEHFEPKQADTVWIRVIGPKNVKCPLHIHAHVILLMSCLCCSGFNGNAVTPLYYQAHRVGHACSGEIKRKVFVCVTYQCVISWPCPPFSIRDTILTLTFTPQVTLYKLVFRVFD